MVTTPDRPISPPEIPTNSPAPLTITWQRLPDGFRLEEKPVENTCQPLLAGALRESLEITDRIQPTMLIASNFGLCATINNELILKAPDWLWVPTVKTIIPDRKSYTPHLEGDPPAIVMEFLSATDGDEYSSKPTYPPGKWFFYEQVLQVPTYVIFEPDSGLLETYRLADSGYQLEQPDENGHHWIPELNLFLGTWRGQKEERTGYWLRWWDPDRQILPWAVEKVAAERQRAEEERQRAEEERQRAETERQRAEEERQRADQEQQRAEAERQRADRLAELLRSQGIDPDALI